MTSSLTDSTLPSLNVQGPRNYPEAAFTRQFLELYKFATKFLWEVWLRSPAPFLVKNVKKLHFWLPLPNKDILHKLVYIFIGASLRIILYYESGLQISSNLQSIIPGLWSPFWLAASQKLIYHWSWLSDIYWYKYIPVVFPYNSRKFSTIWTERISQTS